MNAYAMAQLLTKSGYQVLGTEAGAIILEDPTCIIGNFKDFIDFAWVVMGGLAAMLLFGWGLALIRGAKLEITENIKNLFLLFAGLALIPALVSFLLNQEILQCKKIRVSISDINDILVMKDASFEKPAVGVEAVNDAVADSDAVVAGIRTIAAETRRINNRLAIDARTVLSERDRGIFSRVVQLYGLRIRGPGPGGDGRLGAHRVEDGPQMHAGTDILRASGADIPAFLDGRITSIDQNRRSGFTGVTVRNNNGTTAYYLYVDLLPGFGRGSEITAGRAFARSQNLSNYREYRNANVPNHIHFELSTGNRRSAGDIINIETLF